MVHLPHPPKVKKVSPIIQCSMVWRNQTQQTHENKTSVANIYLTIFDF